MRMSHVNTVFWSILEEVWMAVVNNMTNRNKWYKTLNEKIRDKMYLEFYVRWWPRDYDISFCGHLADAWSARKLKNHETTSRWSTLQRHSVTQHMLQICDTFWAEHLSSIMTLGKRPPEAAISLSHAWHSSSFQNSLRGLFKNSQHFDFWAREKRDKFCCGEQLQRILLRSLQVVISIETRSEKSSFFQGGQDIIILILNNI